MFFSQKSLVENQKMETQKYDIFCIIFNHARFSILIFLYLCTS